MAETSHWSPLIESPAWRFSLKNLLLGIAVIAVALVARRKASGAWTAALMAIAQLVLAVSILLVVFRRGTARAFWLGFAIFGWLYLLLLMLGSVGEALTPGTESPFSSYHLATTRLSNGCYHWMFDEAFEKYFSQYPVRPSPIYPSSLPPVALGSYNVPPAQWPPPGAPPPPGPDEESFTNVAHALWTLLLALCGGLLAKWFYATQGRPPEDRATGVG